MEKKTTHFIIKIVIFVYLILLIWLLAYSLIYSKGKKCNQSLEFKKIINCSEECIGGCISEGFPVDLNHTLLGGKYLVEGSIKRNWCSCKCYGCRD